MFQDDPPWPPSVPPAAAIATSAAPGWRARDLLLGSLLLFVGFVVTIGAGLGIAWAARLDREDPSLALILATGTLVWEAWAGILVLLLARRRGLSLADLGLRTPPNAGLVGAALLGAYVSLAAYAAVVYAAESVTGADLSSLREGNNIPEDLPRTVPIWTLLGLAVVVAAPLGEELFFRGLVFRGLARIAGPALAVAGSGLAFAAVHANVAVVLPFAAIGMIFAWAYRASGSLWTTILAHAIFNGVSFTLAVMGVGS